MSFSAAIHAILHYTSRKLAVFGLFESVCVTDPVETVIGRIARGDIHALVVLDDVDGLVGIVTNRDLLQYLLSE